MSNIKQFRDIGSNQDREFLWQSCLFSTHFNHTAFHLYQLSNKQRLAGENVKAGLAAEKQNTIARSHSLDVFPAGAIFAILVNWNRKLPPAGKHGGTGICRPEILNGNLLPASMHMVFQRRTPRQLALQIFDPKHNEGRTKAQLIDHMAKVKIGKTANSIHHAILYKFL